jgi:hypothetical protein
LLASRMNPKNVTWSSDRIRRENKDLEPTHG